MKKVFLLSCIMFAVLGTATSFGQSKKKDKSISVIPTIKTEVDSVSYIYGLAMVQGLPQFLIQAGVLVDIESINAEYSHKLSTEVDDSRKKVLEKEFKSKIDSVTTLNNARIKDFISGFNETLHADKNKEAYYTGISIAGQVSKNSEQFAKEAFNSSESINKIALAHAFFSSLQNQKPLLDIENPQEVLQERMQKIQMDKAKEEEEKIKAEYKDQIAANEKFLTDNKSKSGVITLPSGLQYEIVTEGNGAIPTASDIVKVHYKGELINGIQFDSSYDRGEPTSFSAGHVIAGWTEALTMMPVGSKWKLYIPQELGYGARDQGTIKPFSTLIFEVELLDVINAQAAEEMMNQENQ